MRFLALTMILNLFFQGEIDLCKVRDLYFGSYDEKVNASKLQEILEPVTEDSRPVLECYKGAAEMLKAKYSVNPINKFSAFNKGKKLIEHAISHDTANVECRFIRYSIQTNIPAFLGYFGSIEADKTFISQAVDTLKDEDLKNKIVTYLKRKKPSAEIDTEGGN